MTKMRYVVEQLTETGEKKIERGEPLGAGDVEVFGYAETFLQAVLLGNQIAPGRRFEPGIVDTRPNEPME